MGIIGIGKNSFEPKVRHQRYVFWHRCVAPGYRVSQSQSRICANQLSFDSLELLGFVFTKSDYSSSIDLSVFVNIRQFSSKPFPDFNNHSGIQPFIQSMVNPVTFDTIKQSIHPKLNAQSEATTVKDCMVTNSFGMLIPPNDTKPNSRHSVERWLRVAIADTEVLWLILPAAASEDPSVAR